MPNLLFIDDKDPDSRFGLLGSAPWNLPPKDVCRMSDDGQVAPHSPYHD